MLSSIQTLIKELMKKKTKFPQQLPLFSKYKRKLFTCSSCHFHAMTILGMSQHRMCSFQSLRKCALLLNVLALFLILLVVVWLVSYCPTPFQELVWHLAHWLKLGPLFDNVCLVKLKKKKNRERERKRHVLGHKSLFLEQSQFLLLLFFLQVHCLAKKEMKKKHHLDLTKKIGKSFPLDN